ncbi:hypothetical protein [Tuwongella immobilis]|uniref:Uncharacterized protein n=1 Tax=Tuwongella immobilis TaxID=692036 RepID=A0A6C2YXJ7_9BACT|nr:hypothetical protein [Tuwongella immobilis]VIP05532.1 unnamed protein product [Tuwongella immobilis]VTS08420.1 unnamed protein product [Tuwongella immobilis]
MIHRWRMLWLLLMLSISSNSIVGAEPDLDFETIRREWQILQTMELAQTGYKITDKELAPRTNVILLDFHVKKRSNHWLVAHSNPFGSSTIANSEKYVFVIRSEPLDAPWTLLTIEQDTSSPNADAMRAAMGFNLFVYPLTAIQSGFDSRSAMRVCELPQLPGFQVTNSASAKDGLIRLSFRCDAGNGELLLDPKRHYLPVQSICRGRNTDRNVDWRNETDREVDPASDGKSIQCRRLEYRLFVTAASASEKMTVSHRYDYSGYTTIPAPEEEFRLSHYGLPEPAGSESAGSASVGVEPASGGVSRTWYVVGAVVLFVVAGLFRWLARKRTHVAAG